MISKVNSNKVTIKAALIRYYIALIILHCNSDQELEGVLRGIMGIALEYFFVRKMTIMK